jgi:hypothetical protein
MRVYDPRMLKLPATSLLAAALAWPALAGDEDGRYRMVPTADGFLKLDTRSGAVSECKPASDGYRCRLVPDEQRALQAEIDRLAGENGALKEQLGKASPGRSAKPSPALPSEDEVDRAFGYMEMFLRRLLSILRDEPGKPF